MSAGNRSLIRTQERHTAWINLSFVSGSTGAVPSMSSASMRRSRGIVSVTRNSTGNYTVVLERGANDIVQASGFVKQATPALTGAYHADYWSDAVTDATPSFTFQLTDKDGTAVDATTGDVVNFGVRVKYSNGYA